MNARRRSISNAREEFKRTVREAIVNLEDKYAFSHEHAVQSVLHEIVMFTGASALVDEERVFTAMKLHGLSWEEAIRALVVSNAIDQLAKNTSCVTAAVEKLTKQLRQAELWKHSATDISSLTSVSQSVVAPRILHPLPATAGKTSHHVQDTREGAKREKRETEPSIPIPTEITAVSDFDVEEATTTKVSNSASKNATKTTNNTRKRPHETNSTSTKPDAANRKPSRPVKRTRETVAEEECNAKRPC